ncbi:DUF4175 family protein [bacterium]|nr:DUF4175 family protein [bacterium]
MQPGDNHRRLDRWRGVQRRARIRLLLHGLVAWLAIVGAVGLVVLVTLGLNEPPGWAARGLSIVAAVIAAITAVVLLWPVWRRLSTRTRLARLLDRAGGHHDTLSAVDEVLRDPERWRADTPIRQALVGRLLARGDRLLGDLDLARLLPVARPWTTFAALAVVLVVGTSLVWTAPGVLSGGWERTRSAWAGDRGPQGGLRPVAGPPFLVAGETRTVAALDLVATEPEPVICEVQVGQGAWRSLAAEQVPVPAGDPALGVPYERWEAVLREIREDVRVRFRRGERVSETVELEVWRPPLLTELAATVTPPAYTRRPPRELPRLPAYLEVPVGSRLELRGHASSALSAAMLVGPTDTTALAVDARQASGTVVVDTARRFRVRLVDARGLEGHGELVHEVAVVPDRVPDVRLRRPDDDGDLPLKAPLRLDVTAEDDHGLVAVDLLVRRGDDQQGVWVEDLPGAATATDDEGWQRIALLDDDGLPRRGRREVELGLGPLTMVTRPREVAVEAAVSLTVELGVAELGLVPGDVLELMVAALDNRQPPPPGEGRSSVLRLEVPSSLELLAEREGAASEHQAGLAEMRRQTETLASELERLRRELLKNPRLDWDRRQELQAALEQQQALRDQIEKLTGALGEDLEKLAENRLTSPELLEKMDRIAELLADHEDRSLEALLESLRESLDEMSPKEMTLAMEDLQREQTDLQRRLDTAMDMLDDLAREQELEGLVDLAAEMIAEQQRLAEESRRQAAQDSEEAGSEEAGSEEAEGDEAEGEEAAAGEEDAEGQDQEDGEGEPQDGESQDGEPQDGESQDGEPQDGDEAENQDAGGESPDSEELARRQEALAEQLESLEKQLEESLAELEEQAESGDESAAEQEMREALEEALAQLEQQQTGQTMQDAGESMQQENSDQASQQMEQALTDLAGLYHVLLKTQAAMQMAMKQEQAGQMRDVAADLLALSERQETVSADVPPSLHELRADDLARRQNEVVQGTVTVRDALGEVAEAAPQEILRMLSQLDELIEVQGDVLDQLHERRARSARRAATTSLAEMNRMVINLLTQAQMTGQGGGSGQPQPMLSQQLRQMSEQQSGLNTLAEQLRRKQGRISQELRAGMQRLQQGQQGLAGQARELAEQQEQLEREGGDTGRLLGDLEALAEEMTSVGDDAADGLITEETLRRQERILSRLLDMHNASRERDWARRRESRSADELYADQEGTEGPPLETAEPEQRRWRPIEEAPPAYRELVRRYFHEVQRLHEDAGRDASGRTTTRGGDGI